MYEILQSKIVSWTFSYNKESIFKIDIGLWSLGLIFSEKNNIFLVASENKKLIFTRTKSMMRIECIWFVTEPKKMNNSDIKIKPLDIKWSLRNTQSSYMLVSWGKFSPTIQSALRKKLGRYPDKVSLSFVAATRGPLCSRNRGLNEYVENKKGPFILIKLTQKHESDEIKYNQ